MFEFMYHLRRDKNTTLRLELYENGFFSIPQKSIYDAEEFLGFQLPSELKALYLEIGEGRLQTGSNGQQTDFNNLASPDDLIALQNGTSDWLMPYSELEKNTLPFFQRDVDLFLCLHPHSENPNAVHWMWGQNLPNGTKICDSLVEFFERLVEDPNWFNPSKP